jgi:hypothetical protein
MCAQRERESRLPYRERKQAPYREREQATIQRERAGCHTVKLVLQTLASDGVVGQKVQKAGG